MMKVVLRLADIEPWCLTAKPGEAETFSVADDVSQDEASVFAFEMNQKTDKRVWIHVQIKKLGLAPEPTTTLEVRCTH